MFIHKKPFLYTFTKFEEVNAMHHSFKFDYLTKVSKPFISCESYENFPVSILQFIEVSITKKALFNEKNIKNIPILKELKVFLINSDNLHKDFSIEYSLKHCNQKHADILILYNKRIKIYDVKNYNINTIHLAHLSIFHGNMYTYLRETNNIVSSIFRESKKNSKIVPFYLRAKNFQDNIKDSKEKFLAVYNVMLEMLFDINAKDLFISFCYPIDPDYDYQAILDNEGLSLEIDKFLNENEPELLKKLIIIQCNNKKKILEELYNELKEKLDKLTEEKKTKYLCTLEEKHKKAIVKKQDQQYYAALPHKLQEAKKIENLFESLELKQEEIKKKKDDIDFLFNNNKGKIDIEEKDNEKYQQNDT